MPKSRKIGKPASSQPSTAVHRFDVLLAIFCRFSATSADRNPPPQIQDETLHSCRDLLLDIAIDVPAHVHGAGRCPFAHFFVFANIHEQETFTCVDAALNVRELVSLFSFLLRSPVSGIVAAWAIEKLLPE